MAATGKTFMIVVTLAGCATAGRPPAVWSPITPGEVEIPGGSYDPAPLVVTSGAFGGKGRSPEDPIVIRGCRIRSDSEDTPPIIIAEPDLTVVIDHCTLVAR